MLTKRDFEKMAKLFSEHYKKAETSEHKESITRIAASFAAISKEDNKLFSYSRFFDACLPMPTPREYVGKK